MDNSGVDLTMEDTDVTDTGSKDLLKQMDCEQKKAAANEEMRRMNQLPANSTYAIHRLRVLNKILQLMAIQLRTAAQDEELELLFAGLHL